MIEQHCEIPEVPTTLATIISLKQPTLLIVESNSPFIYHGDEEYNKQAVKELDIPVYEIGHSGGTIVGGAGDLSIGIFFPLNIDARSDYILQRFVDIFQNHGIAAEVNNNDVLVDGKKIIGSAHLASDDLFALCHIFLLVIRPSLFKKSVVRLKRHQVI